MIEHHGRTVLRRRNRPVQKGGWIFGEPGWFLHRSVEEGGFLLSTSNVLHECSSSQVLQEEQGSLDATDLHLGRNSLVRLGMKNFTNNPQGRPVRVQSLGSLIVLQRKIVFISVKYG